MERIVCILIGYACGLLQTGFLYGRWNHMDIREHGSGNAGTTNALRTLGWKAGVITFLGDSLKCVLAVIIVKVLFGNIMTGYENMLPLLGLYAGTGAVLGHNFPFYLKFKGGKGIAATAGLLLSTNIYMALIAIAAFIIVVALTRYISVGSLLLVVMFVIEMVVYGQMGGFQVSQAYLYEMYAIAIFLMVLAFYRHRENIERLRNGTENKFGSKKKEEQV